MAKSKVEELEADLVRQAEELGRAVIGPGGREYVSARPVAAPIGYRMPPSTVELIRDMVRKEMSAAAEAQGFESFEDADDFDVDDDTFDPRTPYEAIFDGPLSLDSPLGEPDKPAEAASPGVPPQPGGAPQPPPSPAAEVPGGKKEVPKA